MRKVKNNAVIKKIARANLRGSRKKHVVVLLAVTLTTLMFTTIFSVMMSLNATSQNSTMRQVGGSSMAGFKCMLPEDYEAVKADPKTRDVSYRIIIGDAVNPELGDTRVEVNCATEANAGSMFCAPTTGTMPEEKMDAAMSTIALDKLGIAHRLGEKFSLDIRIGQEIKTCEFTLCGFWEGDPVAMSQMCFLSRQFCDEVAPTPEIPSRENLDMYRGYWMIDFNYRTSFDIQGQTEALMKRLGWDENEVSYGVNWAYSTSDIDMTTVLIYVIMLAVILLAGYLIIYNIFYINVVADIHSYGLLKTIGTTGRQLKKLVRRQAMYYCAVGIPLGLILGTLGARVLFPMVAGTLAYNEMAYTFSISPFIYLFAVLFSLVTVLLSCSKPCRTAARVSPVEAVSYNEVAHAQKRKKARRVRPVTLAVSGLSRSKKKLCIVAFSLSLSLLLVNSVYAIVKGFDADKYVSGSIVGDFSIQDVSVHNFSYMEQNYSGVSEEDQAYLGSLDGVIQSPVYYMEAAQPLDAHIKELMESFEKNVTDAIDKEAMAHLMDASILPCNIYGVDSFPLNYMEVYEGEIDAEKFLSGGYAIVRGMQLADPTAEPLVDFYGVGDTIELEFADGTKQSYEVMAVAELPYPLTTQSYDMVEETVCIPSADLLAHTDDKGALYSVLTVEEDKREAVDAAVKSYVEGSDNLSYVSKESYLQEFRDYINVFYLVGGALAAVLALIGILNFVNAIVTGLMARQQEFAMMEAVGMTARQLKQMLVWEGVCYAMATTVLAVLASILAGKFLIQIAAGEIWFFTYHFTVTPILLCLPVLLLLTTVIPYMACRSMQKTSVVERMKVE